MLFVEDFSVLLAASCRNDLNMLVCMLPMRQCELIMRTLLHPNIKFTEKASGQPQHVIQRDNNRDVNL